VAKKALEGAGFNVIAAEDSVEANAQTKKQWGVVDLIIADINLPGLTGGEYADYFKSINPGLKILYMSGAPVTDPAVRQHLESDEAFFVAKPFSPYELILAVKKTLE
jgi:two-component system cell cycle sensor histidine kinase/response regulator CckA